MFKRFLGRKPREHFPTASELQEIAELRIIEEALLHRVLEGGSQEWFWNVRLKITQYCLDRKVKESGFIKGDKLPNFSAEEHQTVLDQHCLLKQDSSTVIEDTSMSDEGAHIVRSRLQRMLPVRSNLLVD